MVLGWYENLPKEEIPPHWMWPFDKELEAWFKRVDEKRKAGRGKPSGSDSSDEAPMVQNELTKGIR